MTHLPQKYDSLRHVPGYKDFTLERFKRCLDLYLVPRALKQRMNVDPETWTRSQFVCTSQQRNDRASSAS